MTIEQRIKNWEIKLDTLINVSSKVNCSQLLKELAILSDDMRSVNSY